MSPSSKLKDADFPVTAFKDQPLDHPKIQVLRILAREYSEKFRRGTELEKSRIVELIVDIVRPGEGGCCFGVSVMVHSLISCHLSVAPCGQSW